MNHAPSHRLQYDTVSFGMWVYILSDCLLFASLFATNAVLQGNTFGGPSGKELFNLPFILAETLVLLSSSFTCGIAYINAHRERSRETLLWLTATMLLGAAFLAMEFSEFSRLIAEGSSWQRSGFLSAFFTLVGTHGLHVTGGMLFMGVLALQLALRGFTPLISQRIAALALFWHFLDVVWIFIFTFVYLLGSL